MSADIGKGDLVAARYTMGFGPSGVTAGSVYTVAWVGTTGTSCTTCGQTGQNRAMGLEGVAQAWLSPVVPMHWCVCEFRKLDRGEFNHLLQVNRVREDA